MHEPMSQRRRSVRPNDVSVSWEGVLEDRAVAMLMALRAARDELGRWPTAAERDRGGRRPSSRTFVRHFDGWREARWAELGTRPRDSW